jgi:DNA polymerase III epsilon subunit-like protein
MKHYRFWLDTETTGLRPEMSQILEYAVVVEDNLGEIVETLEVRLLLKPNINPSKEALEINKIDPYSSAWRSSAITEERAAEKLADLCEKYSFEGVRPVIVAYNAFFDCDHLRMMFARHGIIFESCFNSAVIDPLKTAKDLVAKKKLETKILTKAAAKGRKPVSYSSCKLEDVANALGVNTGKAAHRALNDVETMLAATRAMFKLMFDKEMFKTSLTMNKLSFGKAANLIIESSADGLRQRPVVVIKNDFDQKQITFLDLLDYERIGLSPSNLRTISYSVIFDEVDLDKDDAEKLDHIFDSNKSYYTDRVK